MDDGNMKLTTKLLRSICEALLMYDPGVVEIIQFGSSVYMREYAKDMDLIVFTKKAKEYGGYVDCIHELDVPFDIDMDVQEIGKDFEDSFAIQVIGAYRVLYGDGRWLRKATEDSVKRLIERLEGDPTFREARSRIRGAILDFKRSFEMEEEIDKDRDTRSAFNGLAHAARIASLTYLARENLGWRGIELTLPSQYRGEFSGIFQVLHVKYFYHGEYPRENVGEEFERWLKVVEGFVEKLEAEVKGH